LQLFPYARNGRPPGDSRGCGSDTGGFTVTELAFGPYGSIAVDDAQWADPCPDRAAPGRDRPCRLARERHAARDVHLNARRGPFQTGAARLETSASATDSS
jgi:hypothetical protein